MKKILIVAASGMLGHVVKKHFELKGDTVFYTSRKLDDDSSLFYDATLDVNKIITIIEELKPEVVINCMGILNKDAEVFQERAVLINSYLPHLLATNSTKLGYKFIHISTDCVFSGSKGAYAEDDFKDALDFYGQSKALGEVITGNSLTLRTSIIGPDPNPQGIGLFKWFMAQDTKVKGYSNAFWSGVTTVELAKQIEEAIMHDLRGLYHVTNQEPISKYELLKLIAKVFNKDIDIEKDSDFHINKSLIITKKDFIFKVPDYKTMLEEMKEWMEVYLEGEDK